MTQSANFGAQVALAGRPTCLSQKDHDTAVTLCAQKRVVGHEAVAAFGRTLGATDPNAEAISLSPCEYELLPVCPASTEVFKKATPAASSAAKLSTPRAAPAAAPKASSDTKLIVGGVLAGAIVLGIVFYKLKD